MAAFLQWNCRGFRSNYDDIKALILEHAPVCFCLQETFLKAEDKATVRSFSIFCKNRQRNTDQLARGGVALLVRNTTPAAPVPLTTPLEAVAARLSIGFNLTVCSLYIPPNSAISLSALDSLVQQLPPPFIIMGDFNGHNPIWGGVKTDMRGLCIERFLSNHDLCLLNTGSDTYFHTPTRNFTAIDLTICSPCLFADLSWEVTPEVLGSDHFPLVIRHQGAMPCRLTRPPRWVIEKADWVNFQTQSQLRPTFLDGNIDSAVKLITSTIITAADCTIPKTSTRLPLHPKPYWNADCTAALKNQKRAWGIFRRYPTTTNLLTFKRARAKARYVRRQSSKEAHIKFTSGLKSTTSSKVVWDRVRKVSGKYPSSPLPILQTGSNTVSDLRGIADTLGETFAQHSSSTNYTPEFLALKTRAEKRPLNFSSAGREPYNSPFTAEELLTALRLSGDTSVGPDGIHYRMLKNLSASSKDCILALFNRIWSEQVFPSAWRKAIVIGFPKPGKDPSNPSNYRPIALTSCLCKVLERMINARLVWFLETNNLLSNTQCGFRRQRCTQDHLVRLDTSIREAFVKKEHLVAVFFDMEKAYDTTWKFGVLRDLHTHGLRGALPIFIRNFLTDRSFQVRVGSTLSKSFIQEQGVPQGCVLSVTLFSVKIDAISRGLPTRVSDSLYVDDFGVFCRSPSMNTIERQLQLAINHVSRWTTENGFRVSTQKTVCVHFCRLRGLHLDPELRLSDTPIPVVDEVKFLGLTLDRKLTYLSHIRQLKVRCTRSLNILKVLTSTSWGADRCSMLRIYRAVVRSKLDYGSIVYGSACQSYLARLDPIHHQGLRLCTGAFRTSPVHSLYAESDEPPLTLRRQQLSLNYVFKIGSMPFHPTFNCIMHPQYEAMFLARPSASPTFGLRMKTLLGKLNLTLSGIAHSERVPLPPWTLAPPQCDLSLSTHLKADTPHYVFIHLFNEHRFSLSDHLPIFTDGSKSRDSVGSAFVCCGSAVSDKLPSEASVYSAELHAISLALAHVEARRHMKTVIYTDSLSTLQALQSTSLPTNNILQSVLSRLQRLLSSGYRILLCWIPGHVGIPGNELADNAARNATSLPGTPTLIPATDFKPVIRERIRESWQVLWTAQVQNKLAGVKPELAPWTSSFRANRREEVVLCRLRIGHSHLTHVHLLMGEDAAQCGCGAGVVTVQHILLDCRLYTAERNFYFTEPFTLSSILGVSSDLLNLFDFLKKILLFDRI